MNLNISSPSVLERDLESKLSQILGAELSASGLKTCLQAKEVIKPNTGEQFWRSSSAQTGIFIILAGKVRLLDSQDNPLITLEPGASFGESSLFPKASFQPYTARASFRVQLAYIPGQALPKSEKPYSGVKGKLYQNASQLDLLLICRQNTQLENEPLGKLTQLVDSLQCHRLTAGILPDTLTNEVLWLVRQGELVSPSQTITPGSIYFLNPQTKDNPWRIAQPTEMYSLSSEDSKSLGINLPQFTVDVTSLPENSQSLSLTQSKQKLRPLPPRRSNQLIHSTTSKSSTQLPVPDENKTPQEQPQKFFPSPTQRAGHFWQRLVRRYPFYAQQSASDCGAACMVMIGRYWNKKFSLNRIRDLARVNRSGSSLKGLVAAAETLGFITKPVKANLNQFAQQKLPAIAHWEGNHYIVVYEIKGNRIIVGDPAMGQRTLTRKEFVAGWTGYALLLEPTTSLKSDDANSGLWWQFLELLKPHSFVLSEVFIASVLIQLFALISPLLTQIILDRVVVQRSSSTLMAVGLGLLIFGLFRVAMTGLRQYLLDHTAQKINVSLIVGFIRHTLRLPLSFFESRYVGDIMARVQENEKIQNFLTGEALSIILDIMTVFVYVGMMFWYSWQLALAAVAIFPFFAILALVATPFLQKISREIFGASAKESSYLIEALSGVNTVKSMAVEQRVRWKWEELLNESVKKGFTGQVISNKLQVFSSTIEVIASTTILWLGAWQVINNQLTIGQLVAFNMLFGSVIGPFKRITVLWNQLQEVIIAVERINDVLDAEPEENADELRQNIGSIQGHIRFENVTFRYHAESETNVLENLNFEVQPGQTVALVGRSGSGKTTIAKLILGLYAPTDGKVLIDGCDLTTVSLRSLREQIGVVDQSNFLFGGTVRENISISHPQASLEAVREAAIQAGAHEFIEKLPLGYETPIGERGGTLSGGQCQRLAIARALLGNPGLLILDEATSNLDAESERIIQNNFNTILQGRTTVVIAHRLSTIRQADIILVLDRGILVESGTHHQLMAKRGHYFYLNQQQLTNDEQ